MCHLLCHIDKVAMLKSSKSPICEKTSWNQIFCLYHKFRNSHSVLHHRLSVLNEINHGQGTSAPSHTYPALPCRYIMIMLGVHLYSMLQVGWPRINRAHPWICQGWQNLSHAYIHTYMNNQLMNSSVLQNRLLCEIIHCAGTVMANITSDSCQKGW